MKMDTQKILKLSGNDLSYIFLFREFWEVLYTLDEEQSKKFLMFVSGSYRAPIKGLTDLPFIVSRHGPDSEMYDIFKLFIHSLPSAHTCFNHLLLPEYKSKEKLREKLLLAINNSEGFGLF